MAPDNCKIDTMKQWPLDNYMREYNDTMAFDKMYDIFNET